MVWIWFASRRLDDLLEMESLVSNDNETHFTLKSSDQERLLRNDLMFILLFMPCINGAYFNLQVSRNIIFNFREWFWLFSVNLYFHSSNLSIVIKYIVLEHSCSWISEVLVCSLSLHVKLLKLFSIWAVRHSFILLTDSVVSSSYFSRFACNSHVARSHAERCVTKATSCVRVAWNGLDKGISESAKFLLR